MSELGSLYKNITETQLVKLGAGRIRGFVVNSHSSGTLKLLDGVDNTAGAKATSTLTTSGIVPAVHAINVLTVSGNFTDDVAATNTFEIDTSLADGETVTIGATVYRFKDETAQAYDVHLGSSGAEALDNLKSAINADGTGDGSDYHAGTLIHPTVTATTNSDTEQTIQAKVAGADGNDIGTIETSGGSWDTVTLEGGLDAETVTIGDVVYRWKATTEAAYDINIGATAAESLDFLKLAINGTGVGDGTDYHAGTVAHPLVIATTNGDTTQAVVSRTYGTANNTLATTETGAVASWADTTLGGGTGASNPGVATTTATFVIDDQTYYFTTELSETVLGASGAVVNEILWVTNDATALDNMKLAINGSGTEGTDYSTGTNAHPTVTATTNGNTTQVIEAKVFGSLGNNIATTETMTTTAWTGTTLSGGTDAARTIMNTYTPATGSSVITFPDAINYVNGLYAVIAGTSADITIVYD